MAVAQKCGSTEPVEIAEFLGYRSGCDDDRLWRRYRTGEISPSDKTLNGVENLAPMTRNVYTNGPDDTCLWNALDPSTPVQERYRLIQTQCNEWSVLSDKQPELQLWLEYWPPRHRHLAELYDELPPLLEGLAKHYPLQALSIAYNMWHSMISGFLGIAPTPDALPILRCIVFLFPIVEARLKHYGITRSELFEIADPLLAIAATDGVS